MLYLLSPRPDAALTSTSGNGQWRSQVDQSHRIVLPLTHRRRADITLSDEGVREIAHRAADLAQPAGQAMSAMMGADPGYLCALQHGDGHRDLLCGHWRKRAIGGVRHKTIGVRDGSP